MSVTDRRPPRVAYALLESLLRPSDSESIPGDLLEEYREVRCPSLGPLRADVWYMKQVLSVLWRVAWPCVVAIIALRVVSFPLPRGWNPSLVSAPGVSLLDALVFLWAGYYGSQRTGRFITGVVMASVTSLVGFTTFFIYAAVTAPSLLRSPFEKPFIFVIVATLLGLALGFGVAAGIVGAAVGRWLPPSSLEGLASSDCCAAWRNRIAYSSSRHRRPLLVSIETNICSEVERPCLSPDVRSS